MEGDAESVAAAVRVVLELGEPVTEGVVDRVAVKVEERVVRAVADPVRVPAADFELVGEGVVVFVDVLVSLGDVEGDPDTVSGTVAVAEREAVIVADSVGVPVVVRVVETLRDVVAVPVGLIVWRVVGEDVVEAEGETVGSLVPVGVVV